MNRAIMIDPAPPPRFIQPTDGELFAAARIIDSHPVVSAYGSCEWNELGDDGRVWIAAIVREATARAMQQPRPVPGDLIVEINAFLTHMAERFRERTTIRVLGFRIPSVSREHAMHLALVTYDATLDMIGVPFGHPDHQWDRASAHEFVDTELQHWEA